MDHNPDAVKENIKKVSPEKIDKKCPRRKLMLDFLRGSCYCNTVREENKAEFHSHLSAFMERLGFILHNTQR